MAAIIQNSSLFMTIEEHISLATLTTFRIGGLARYVVTVAPEEIAEAVAFAESHQLPIFVLGAGSNLLVFDEHIEAVVVRVAPQRVFEYTERGGDVVCIAGAGDPWDEVVADAVRRGAGGIENLSLIPGTVGAAPVQNIGAYGTELADVLEWVEVFDMRAKKVRRLTAAECQLGYRTSFFKTIEGRQLIVSRVAMRLRTHASPNISYKDLATYFEKKGNTAPTCAEVRDAVVSIRRAKLPDPAVIPNAGSFFKNPVIEKSHADELGTRFPGMPLFPVAGSHMFAHQCDLEPGEFVWTGGDTHLYTNHLEQANLQLTREPFPLPKLVIKRKPDSVFDYQYEDFEIVNYQYHPGIKAPIAV